MVYAFKDAERVDSKVFLGLYGLSGSGKTLSALLVGRGLVGPNGKLALADTEEGRGMLYADVVPGGYQYTKVDPPFTPGALVQVIKDAEAAGIDCLVIDSASHEWEGEGGVCEQAAAIEKRTGKAGLHCWNKPKKEHQKLILKMMRTKIHLVVCIRGKRKSHQVKNSKGETEIFKDDWATPKQSEDFIFECMAHAEVMTGEAWLKLGHAKHSIRVTKLSHPDLVPVFYDGAVMSIETGKAFAEWCKGGKPKGAGKPPKVETRSTPATQAKPAEPPPEDHNDSELAYVPDGGWPEFGKLSPWLVWSRDKFLPTATAPMAQAWREWWRDFFDAALEHAATDAKAKVEVDRLESMLKEAMKRNPQ